MRLMDAEALVWAHHQAQSALRLDGEPPYMRTQMPHQVGLIRDRARQRSLIGTRRSGKTKKSEVALFRAVQYPRLVADRWADRGVPPLARYWGPTKERAKELIWRPLIRFADEWEISIDAHETSQTIYLDGPGPNGAEIRIVGAQQDKEAQKKRGDPSVYEEVEEAQFYGDTLLETICEDIIGPSLLDFGGSQTVQGTPGVVFKGFWFDISGPDAENLSPQTVARRASWSRHHFDVYDNIHIPHAKEEIEKLRIKKGWGLDNPTYLREYRGRWVNDANALYYAWDPKRNTYNGTLPTLPPGRKWSYGFALDLGGGRRRIPKAMRDPKALDAARPALGTMAMVVLAWSDADPYLYERYSRRGFNSLADVAAEDRRLEAELRNVVCRVADCGALGGLIMDEFNERFGIYYESAEKTEKYGAVTVLNDLMRAGGYKTIQGSTLSDEYASLPKDPEDPLESDPRHNDHCADGALYLSRRIKFEFNPPEEVPSAEEQRRREVQAAEQREIEGRREQEREWWEGEGSGSDPW